MAVMYDQYFVQKAQIGANILMVVIAESATVNMSQVDQLIKDFSANFMPVNQVVEDLN